MHDIVFQTVMQKWEPKGAKVLKTASRSSELSSDLVAKASTASSVAGELFTELLPLLPPPEAPKT